MISVKVEKNRNGKYHGFRCKGHAEYDDYGKDIVCSAVSMLVINTINSIEEFTDCMMKVETKDGDIKVVFPAATEEKASLLLDAMILGLQGVAKEYGKTYVSLEIKEV